MNELKRHKKSDKIKWIFTGIAFVLAFVMIAGICMQLFGNDKIKPSNWFKKTECVHIDEDTDGKCDECGEDMPYDKGETADGMVIAPETVGKKMRITSRVLAASEYDDYGVSTLAENAYTLTATVTPSNADDKTVDWSVAWKNADSSWAKGKTVTSYVTVTPTSDGALTATVSCLAAFSEQIIVSVVPRANTDISATCTLDYRQRITGVTSMLSTYVYGGSDSSAIQTNATGGSKSIAFASSSSTAGFYTKSYTLTKSTVYTIPISGVDITYKIAPTSSFRTAMSSQGLTPASTSGATFDTVSSTSSSNSVNMGIGSTKGYADYYGLLCSELATTSSSSAAKFNATNYNKFIAAAKNVSSGGHFTITITVTGKTSVGDNTTFTATTTATFSTASLLVAPTGVSSNQSELIF